MTTVPTKSGSPPTKIEEEQVPERVMMIDTDELSEEDLKTLKKQDPFLYYSIPAVRNAAVRNREVDMASLRSGSGDTSRQASSCSVQLDDFESYASSAAAAAATTTSTSTKVERKSCISFEGHVDLLLEDYFNELTMGDYLNDEEEVDYLNSSTTTVDLDVMFDHFLRRSRKRACME